MKIGTEGLRLVKAFESCMRAIGDGRFRAYLDPIGVLTIGWGHTNHHPPKFDTATVWTQAECDAALARDLSIFEAVVNRLVKVPLNQHQFDALVSFAYNLGEGNLSKSGLLRKVNAGDFAGAALEFQKWTMAGGRVLPGLVRRRKSEALLFQGIPDRNYDGIPDGGRIRPDAPPKVAPDGAAEGAGAGGIAGGVATLFGFDPVTVGVITIVVGVAVFVAFRFIERKRS